MLEIKKNKNIYRIQEHYCQNIMIYKSRYHNIYYNTTLHIRQHKTFIHCCFLNHLQPLSSLVTVIIIRSSFKIAMVVLELNVAITIFLLVNIDFVGISLLMTVFSLIESPTTFIDDSNHDSSLRRS